MSRSFTETSAEDCGNFRNLSFSKVDSTDIRSRLHCDCASAGGTRTGHADEFEFVSRTQLLRRAFVDQTDLPFNGHRDMTGTTVVMCRFDRDDLAEDMSVCVAHYSDSTYFDPCG